jgi:4-hydroxy 2-oxovalerate aldolase|eukprot:COSAG06_NODE_29627_length_553_cov_0.515419_1_plen_140_part_00
MQRGALYNEQVEMLTKVFKEKLPGRVIGFCGANNLQMSLSNSVMAVIEGANLLDGSIMGLGRGPGGTPIENLISFLRNPRYKLRPVLVALQEHVQPLVQSDDTFFGVGVTGCPSLPYLVAGTRNDDPADSLAWCDAVSY